LYYFRESSIHEFNELQRKICRNVIPAIKQGGYFLYITCSVFGVENESVVEFLRSEFGLQYIQGGVIAGYNEKADTMYGCLMQRS
jgi:16S rRNA (cytosine967-C5)-methyltransferase